MKKFIEFISKHAIIILIIVGLLTVFFAYKAMGIGINADYGAFMPWGEYGNSYQGGVPGQKPVLSKAVPNLDNTEYMPITTVLPDSNVYASAGDISVETKLEDYPYSTNYLVLVKGSNLFEPEILDLLDECITSLEDTRELSASSSALDFVTLEKRGTRLTVVPMAPSHLDGWNEESASTFRTRIQNDPVVQYYLVGGDKDSLMFTFQIASVSDQRLEELSAMLDPLRDAGLEVLINGGEVINHKVMEYLNRDLVRLISLCLIVILIVYYLCFRSKRSVLIPMSLSIIGLIWTLGTMAILDIDLTILNIVTPCMVLTLGSAYSIHVLSEYYSNYQKGLNLSPAESTSHIINTILFACLTTVCGFLALCISQTDGLKEFGISVSIGIAYCAILACTYLPAILTITKKPKARQLKSYSNGFMAKLVRFIAINVTKYWIVLLVVLALITIGFFIVKDKISVDSNYMSYFPESDQFGQDSKKFAEEMGGTNPFTIAISAPAGSERFFLQSENLSKVFEYEQTIKESPDILQSISFSSYVAFANQLMTGEYTIPENSGLMNMLSRLVLLMQNQTGMSLSSIISEDGNQISLTIQHWDSSERDLMTTSSITRVMNRMVENLDMLPNGTNVYISGDPVVNVKFSNRLLADQNRSTLLSLGIVFALSFIAFLSLKKAFYIIIPVLSGIMINYLFMYFAGIPFDMVTVSFSSIAIGCGVDDAIHFMLRLKSKQKGMPRNTDVVPLLKDTIIDTGRPIILTTVSIVFGMMMLSFASYTPIRYFGLLMSVTLFGCMISTLVIMPPVVIMINKISNKLRGNK